eukprot:3875773-Alexandrium_andersonii.AAC.1
MLYLTRCLTKRPDLAQDPAESPEIGPGHLEVLQAESQRTACPEVLCARGPPCLIRGPGAHSTSGHAVR